MSSFEQTMMGRSPGCHIPSFVEIGPPVPEKKVFTIYGRDQDAANKISFPLAKEAPHKI